MAMTGFTESWAQANLRQSLPGSHLHFPETLDQVIFQGSDYKAKQHYISFVGMCPSLLRMVQDCVHKE